MKEQRESFVFYRGFREAVKELPEEYQLKVLRYLMDYALDGTEPEESGIEKAMFVSFKPQIDAAQKRYVANLENGRKGGRKKEKEEKEIKTETNPSVTQFNQNQTETNPNVTQFNPKQTETNPNVKKDNPKKPNTNLNDNVNDNVNDNDNINHSPKGEVEKGEIPPNPLVRSKEEKQELKTILDSFSFPAALRQKVEEWLLYKKERRKTYKPTGLHNFLTQIQSKCDVYGERAVIESITQSMANNYEGILWDKIAEEQQIREKSAQNREKKNRFCNYEQRNWDFEALEKREREKLMAKDSDVSERYAVLRERVEKSV